MTTTTVRLTAESAAYGKWTVWLISTEGGTPGGGLHGVAVVPRRIAHGQLSTLGVALVALDPTSEIVPAGTVYRADFRPVAGVDEQIHFTVPVSAATIDAVNYITDPPASLTPTALAAHLADGVAHGGAHPDLAVHNTLGLATQVELDDHAATAHGGTHPDLTTHDTLGLATDAELAAHAVDTTAVHGITDTAALVVTTDTRLSNARTPTAHAASHASAGSDPVTVAESQVTGLSAALAAKIPATEKASAGGVATLDAGGKIPSAQLSALAISEVFSVASQAAMLALTAQRGDLAIRTDLDPDGVFILTTDAPGTLADWVQITAPGAVVSVNGQTGVVSLVKADVGLANVDNTSDVNKPVSAAQQAALDLKAALASPTFTGTPSAPTATLGTDTTQLATTAFVAARARVVTANAQTTAYTLVLTDAGKAIDITAATGVAATVPPNSTVAFPLGTVVEVSQLGAGQVTITAGSGVTLRSSGAKLKTTGQYSACSIRKIATDEWLVSGDLAA